ncbi:MAG: alpha/beta fold hydrolase [Planctomycetota bacterium]
MNRPGDQADDLMQIGITLGGDGTPLKYRRWQHASPKCHVVMVHGVISHGGWYVQSCDRLHAAGFGVDFLDRRGSGLNEEDRGDVDRFETWIDDLRAHVASLRQRSPNVPIVLFGISWGGKLACEFVKRHPDLVASLALICPGLFAKQFPSAMKHRVLAGLKAIGLGSLTFPIPLRDPALFTNVQRWQSYVRDDERTLRRVTVRFALADRDLTRLACAHPERIRVPTWLALAGRDRIIKNEPVRRYVDKINHPVRLTTMYPESAHTFEFDPDPTGYVNDCIEWIERSLNESACSTGT